MPYFVGGSGGDYGAVVPRGPPSDAARALSEKQKTKEKKKRAKRLRKKQQQQQQQRQQQQQQQQQQQRQRQQQRQQPQHHATDQTFTLPGAGKKTKLKKRRRFGSFDGNNLVDPRAAFLGRGDTGLPAPPPPAPSPPRRPARPRAGSDFGSSSFDAGPFGPGGKRKAAQERQKNAAGSSSASDDDDNDDGDNTPSKPSSSSSSPTATAAARHRPTPFRATISPQHGEKRRALPVFACRAALVSALRRHATIIVEGETGSGKTTQIPQYLLEEGWARSGRMIAVTQPRRVAAMSVAERVSEEVGCRLGGRVGYRVRFDDTTTGGVTQIKFMTDGMLLRESMIDPMLSKYACIILDEAHERTLHTDILFAVVKQIQERRNAKDHNAATTALATTTTAAALPSRRRLSLVVMSATLDTEMFSTYFNGAPVYSVPGRTFPVDIFYAVAPQSDYVAATLTSILQTHADAGRTEGDILVFLTGQEEIEDMARLLRDRRARLPNDCAVRD